MFLVGLAILSSAPTCAQTTTTAKLTTNTATDQSTTSSSLIPCAELPVGDLTDDQLKSLVPEGAPGFVRISWKTESQEEVFGFNILRSDKAEGPYQPTNSSIIPGEGTSNLPMAYCYQDMNVNRGQVYFYQIEEVSNSGAKAIIEGTTATRIQVKTIEEERTWLKKKAADAKASQ